MTTTDNILFIGLVVVRQAEQVVWKWLNPIHARVNSPRTGRQNSIPHKGDFAARTFSTGAAVSLSDFCVGGYPDMSERPDRFAIIEDLRGAPFGTGVCRAGAPLR